MNPYDRMSCNDFGDYGPCPTPPHENLNTECYYSARTRETYCSTGKKITGATIKAEGPCNKGWNDFVEHFGYLRRDTVVSFGMFMAWLDNEHPEHIGWCIQKGFITLKRDRFNPYREDLAMLSTCGVMFSKVMSIEPRQRRLRIALCPRVKLTPPDEPLVVPLVNIKTREFEFTGEWKEYEGQYVKVFEEVIE